MNALTKYEINEIKQEVFDYIEREKATPKQAAHELEQILQTYTIGTLIATNQQVLDGLKNAVIDKAKNKNKNKEIKNMKLFSRIGKTAMKNVMRKDVPNNISDTYIARIVSIVEEALVEGDYDGVLLENWIIPATIYDSKNGGKTFTLTLGKDNTVKNAKNGHNVKLVDAPMYVQAFVEIMANEKLLVPYGGDNEKGVLKDSDGDIVKNGKQLYQREIYTAINIGDRTKISYLPDPINQDKYNKLTDFGNGYIDTLNDVESLLKLSLDEFGAEITHNDYSSQAFIVGSPQDLKIVISKLYVWMHEFANKNDILHGDKQQQKIFFDGIIYAIAVMMGEEKAFD